MSGRDEEGIDELLRQLAAGDADRAWRSFLETYGPVLQQVVHLFETETDAAADCFLFVCGHLADAQFRRLRRFRADGPASFPTWLRAVARNLCIDWHRKTHGRVRDGVSPEQPRLEPLTGDDESPAGRLRDPAPDPEMRAAARQRATLVRAVMSRLSRQEQLLIRLRFEQELTLEQIARICGLKDAQTADRRLRQILDAMRQGLAPASGKFRVSSV